MSMVEKSKVSNLQMAHPTDNLGFWVDCESNQTKLITFKRVLKATLAQGI